MKRLVVIPLASLAACTISVTPIKNKPQPPPQRKHWWHKHEAVAKPKPAKPTPVTSPVINQIHEQYKPIYEKLPPQQPP